MKKTGIVAFMAAAVSRARKSGDPFQLSAPPAPRESAGRWGSVEICAIARAPRVRLKMANILAALKRHNIYRVAAAYAVVAWVLGQLVGILMPIFDLPQWIARAFLLLLAFGFPVALFFAWANQLAPESGGAARVSTGKLDWVLAGALFVVIALVSYQQLAPTRTAQSQQAGVT